MGLGKHIYKKILLLLDFLLQQALASPHPGPTGSGNQLLTPIIIDGRYILLLADMPHAMMEFRMHFQILVNTFKRIIGFAILSIKLS